MTARVVCKLDRNRMGPLLALDESELLFTTTAACDINRTILGDLPALSGDYSYELYLYSQSQGSLANLLSYGIAQTGADLAKFVGKESISYGMRVSEGQIWNNNASIATVDAQGERICLGLYLTLGPSSCTAFWYVDGSPVYSQALALGKAWLPAISIGSTTAGDVSGSINFGLNRFDRFRGPLPGWSVQSAGLATIYISVATEAFMSAPSDTPATMPFGPWLINGKQISIKRSLKDWVHRSGGRTNPAAITTLQLDNSKGTFNALIDRDVRDAPLVLQSVDAPAGGVGSLAGAATFLTGIVESVSKPSASIVEVVLRDTLSRFDKPLPCRVVPPYYDEASAGQIWPIGLGAQRNVAPKVLSQPLRLFAIADSPQTNVPLAADMGAPLDPLASPPQYTPALGGAGIQLEVLPVGKFTIDCSSVGDQYIIPGAQDILGGIGAFTTWSGGLPSGWVKPTTPPYPPAVVANGTVAQTSLYGTTSGLLITSHVPYNPAGVGFYYGYPVSSAATWLQPGSTYRFTFRLAFCAGSTQGGNRFGFAILTGLASDPKYWVTPFMEPLVDTLGTTGLYTFSYTCPRDAASALSIFLTLISSFSGTAPSAQSAACAIDNLAVELVGQYQAAPLEGITLKNAFTEILVNRAGESPAVFSAADLDALDALTGYPLGFRWETQPNILDVLTEIADAVGAVIFTDAFGVIRIRQLRDPATGTVVAAFSKANIDVASFRVVADAAEGLTTSFGARRNQSPFTSSDFVSDNVTVPPGLRAQYMRASQFLLSASTNLAQEYKAAQGAPRRILPIDDEQLAAAEGNRVTAPFATKRNYVEFMATYEKLALGIGPSVAPQDLFYGDVITLHLPEEGLINQRMAVADPAPEHFIGDGRVLINAWY